MSIEIHIVTACLVLLALDPAGKLLRSIHNWLERRAIHKKHMENL